MKLFSGGRSPLAAPAAGLAAAAAVAAAAYAAPAGSVTAELKLEPAGAQAAPGYYPIRVALSPEKPPSVRKEPAYRGKAGYAVVRLGNGPAAEHSVVLDEVEPGSGAEPRIYVDVNRNGDLTDDGDGAWKSKRESGGRTMYGVNQYVLRASWRAGDGKETAGEYGLAFYRFSNQEYLLMYRQGARTGTLKLDGQERRAVLVENDADALFSKPVATREAARATRPVWLLVDLDGDGKFSARGEKPELFDIRGPFRMGDQTFEATVAVDGSTLTLAPTTKQALDLTPRPAPRPELLAAGAPAPDFTAEAWGGGTLSLSKYRGKIVILDFWSTWCGPCQRSMPHIQKVYERVKEQGAVVLGVCVWDERPEYERWMSANRGKYTFNFAFDPAGRGSDNIAAAKYRVSGIPTTYVIDREGRVADAIVGYRGETDTRIDEALKKLGLKVD